MPESRFKYLYERLGDDDFQLLVNALLTERYTDFYPLPLRQADGGRDGIRRPGKDLLIYQVKWSVNGRDKKPVDALKAAVVAEEANIRRLVSEGAKQYFLVTNVPSTGKTGSGTFDQLDSELATLSASYGIEMQCIWREGVDAMVDSAPTETKWAYADMLAGWDLIRYLIDEHYESKRDKGLRDLVRKVAAAQWGEDERVKFSQVDIDREPVAELYVDVTADRLRGPRGIAERITRGGRPGRPTPQPGIAPPPGVPGQARLGGAASYLLKEGLPFTLVRGAPGQGKSTLSQFVCQAHRAAFMPGTTQASGLLATDKPRFPVRFDLSDYAMWVRGIDVFDPTAERHKKPRGKTRPAAQSTIECFLAELMSHASGRGNVTAVEVQALFDRVPSLVVMDGLDEVGSAKERERVVKAIDTFCGRGNSYAVPPRVVVTTRPSADELPEPSAELFEVLVLNQLDRDQRREYLRKWCAVRDIHGRDGRLLRNTFDEKTREPYIGELAGNPMQLTILIELLNKRRLATPSQRTQLYDGYMELLLDRESNKYPDSVRKYRSELEEIIPFLGWYLQSRSEQHSLNGRMQAEELGAAMRQFQRTYRRPESVVDELFKAATDRLWALTSKEQGVYEFEVVSLREYFAARFLYHSAGEGDRNFDRTTVFRVLLQRPYWLNTARFYAGNAPPSAVFELSGAIRELLATHPARHAYIASWTLLTDGVFASRPAEAALVLDELCSDTGVPMLLAALDRKEILPLPELPSDRSTNPTWTRLTTAIATSPADPNNRQRVRVLRELLSERGAFAQWWSERATVAVGKSDERAWLELAAGCEAAEGRALPLDGVDLDGGGAEVLLNTGLVPPAGGTLEKLLLQRVIDGECPDVTSIRSMPAQVAVALAPDAFHTTSKTGFTGQSPYMTQRRQDAVRALRRTNAPIASAAAKRAFKSGERGSTFPWSNTATALFDAVGRCWLASEIAILGAASGHQSGHTTKRGPTAFGAKSHPAVLLAQIRQHSNDEKWWRAQRSACTDELALAEWTFALWAKGSPDVIAALFADWESTIANLPVARQQVIQDRAARLKAWGRLSNFETDVAPATEVGAQLLAARVPRQQPLSSPPNQHARASRGASASQERTTSLSQIARSEKWFQVDQIPSYR